MTLADKLRKMNIEKQRLQENKTQEKNPIFKKYPEILGLLPYSLDQLYNKTLEDIQKNCETVCKNKPNNKTCQCRVIGFIEDVELYYNNGVKWGLIITDIHVCRYPFKTATSQYPTHEKLGA